MKNVDPRKQVIYGIRYGGITTIAFAAYETMDLFTTRKGRDRAAEQLKNRCASLGMKGEYYIYKLEFVREKKEEKIL